MTIQFFKAKTLATTVVAIAFSAMLTGCAAPKQGTMFDHASKAIRAAETSGAREYAPVHYMKANEIYSKAEAMNENRRADRAQKLLELATAQASLAKAISEAAQAENSLGFIRTGQIR